MEDIEIIEYKEVDLSNSLLVVAFPTVGLISSIAGHFIIDSLKLEEIGAITSREFMPATVIHKSRPSPPVRIYAGEKTCGPDGSCEQLAVIISEFMPPYNIIKPLADKILKWADKKGCKIVITLEGTHAVGDKKQKFNVYGVGSNTEMKNFLKSYKIDDKRDKNFTKVRTNLDKIFCGISFNSRYQCMLSPDLLIFATTLPFKKILLLHTLHYLGRQGLCLGH